MSVPAYLRNDSKVDFIRVAVQLSAWALKWCKDERLFSRRERWILTGGVWDSAKNTLMYVKMANARSNLADPQDFEAREGYFKLALDSLVALKLLLQIKYEMVLKGFDAPKKVETPTVRPAHAQPNPQTSAEPDGQTEKKKKKRGGGRKLTQDDVDDIFEAFFDMAIKEESLIRGVMRTDAERHAASRP